MKTMQFELPEHKNSRHDEEMDPRKSIAGMGRRPFPAMITEASFTESQEWAISRSD
jgi:hypothetical protein